MTSESGDVLFRKGYTPYGYEREAPEEYEYKEYVGYTGHRLDKGAGSIVYMGARHYDGRLGRFMGFDPVGVLESIESNPQMFNRYAYANNNPYKYNDPNGEEAVEINLGLLGITAGIDNKSGGYFWIARGGLVGLGGNYYDEFNFPTGGELIGNCKLCDATTAEIEGTNLGLGISAALGDISFDYGWFDGKDGIITTTSKDGSKRYHSNDKELEFRSNASIGYSPDLSGEAEAASNKKLLGGSLSINANFEKGKLYGN